MSETTSQPDEKPSCKKCGTDDIYMRWHTDARDCREAASVLDRFKLVSQDGEHLHHWCRRCGFIWITETLDSEAAA